MVSTVHKGNDDEHVEQERKKSQSNKVNRKHVRLLWKDNHVKTITIPQIIDDAMPCTSLQGRDFHVYDNDNYKH